MSLPCNQIPSDLQSKLDDMRTKILDGINATYYSLENSSITQLKDGLAEIKTQSAELAAQGAALQQEALNAASAMEGTVPDDASSAVEGAS